MNKYEKPNFLDKLDFQLTHTCRPMFTSKESLRSSHIHMYTSGCLHIRTSLTFILHVRLTFMIHKRLTFIFHKSKKNLVIT